MKRISTYIMAACALTIAGCATTDVTSTGYMLPTPQDTLDGYSVSSGLEDPNQGNLSLHAVDIAGNEYIVGGYAFAVGRTKNELGMDIYRGNAGVYIQTVVVAPPATGVVEWTGTYAGVHVYDISSDGSNLYGNEVSFGQVIDLTADFGAGTLTGNTSNLSINGVFDGKHLGGTVTHDGLVAELDGLIGSDKVLGAFHGNDRDEVVAGGFAGYK